MTEGGARRRARAGRRTSSTSVPRITSVTIRALWSSANHSCRRGGRREQGRNARRGRWTECREVRPAPRGPCRAATHHHLQAVRVADLGQHLHLVHDLLVGGSVVGWLFARLGQVHHLHRVVCAVVRVALAHGAEACGRRERPGRGGQARRRRRLGIAPPAPSFFPSVYLAENLVGCASPLVDG